ncbi:Sec-independent protein translocase subunit TatA [Arthrobacter liuii]|uniref:Sec-independent protein translocase protein TatA n=1 Tax=Arthrobacter liuii TaxID=1476996 RepID=A0ABQ2AZ47_9MICC|nr:Sec-independent protein translocase subunit TatA [Arthrobacter liuii]GGI02999.1 hypothetical protein GCM10007170_45990 [Arthrobacter liuii]
MGRLFDGPWPIMIIIVVALLLFAAPRLPAMARGLGQSMRILRSEVREMKNDGKPESTEATGPVEGAVVDHPKTKPAEPTTVTDVPPSTRS